MNTPRKFIATALACILVIGAGGFGMIRMAASKRPPAEKPKAESGLAVSTMPVEKQAVRLTALGYGQAEPVNVLAICPRVAGNIVQRHPALDQGGMVKKDEILFQIDDTDYAIAVEKARARVNLTENSIAQYRVSLEQDRDRLKALQQTTRLAGAEYQRLKTLYEKSRVGTLSGLEAAEQAYNTSLNNEKSLAKTVALYPLQITAARNDLLLEQADLKSARLNLGRCTIRAPFTGRIRESSVDVGTYVSVGNSLLTLTDDTLLEIRVPLSDRDAFGVLALGPGSSGSSDSGDTGWISGLDRVDCRVESLAGKDFAPMTARIHRAVKYDDATRTLYLAVRVSRAASQPEEGAPLVEGMFCKVTLSGPTIPGVVKLPHSALNSDNTLFLARAGRLTTLAVSRVADRDDAVFVSGDFLPTDRIITTALANPVENSRLVLKPHDGSGVLASTVSGGVK